MMVVVTPLRHEDRLRASSHTLLGLPSASYYDVDYCFGIPALKGVTVPTSAFVPEARPQLSAAVSQASEAAVDHLSRLYSFRGLMEVTGFVRQHPSLLSPLLEAPEVVSRYFGPGAHLALEVFRDPEAHGHRELFALIETGLEGDASLEALRRFDEGWWLEALSRTDYTLAFALEYADG